MRRMATNRPKTTHRPYKYSFTLSGFESSQASNPLRRKNTADAKASAAFFGPPEGIRTPVLQNRNLLRYPASLQADNY